MGGRFTLSDDSHSVGQVGLNFARVMESVKRAGITHLVFMESERASKVDEATEGDRAVKWRWKGVLVTDLERHGF